jgi:tripartite-type tricarboxylate transporter receptor subunit TctC
MLSRLTRLARYALVACVPLAAQFAHAQAYPTKPITIVVPFSVGGSADLSARLIAQELSTSLGKPVIVENKAGANTQIATNHVVRSPADGYTILFGTTSLINNVHVYPKLPYDVNRDLVPVAGIAEVPAFLAVGSKVKEATATDFIAAARKSGSSMNYVSVGTGSTLHLAGEWFKSAVGFQAVHVPQKGGAEVATSLASGDVEFSFVNLGPVQAQIDAGRVKLLAVAGNKRFPLLPNLPTLQEAGLQGADLSSFFILVAPRGTPPDVIATLNREVNKALANPAVSERLLKLGSVPMVASPEQIAARMQQDSVKWGTVIKQAKITLE